MSTKVFREVVSQVHNMLVDALVYFCESLLGVLLLCYLNIDMPFKEEIRLTHEQYRVTAVREVSRLDLPQTSIYIWTSTEA